MLHFQSLRLHGVMTAAVNTSQQEGQKKKNQQTSVVYLAIFAQAHGEDTKMKLLAEWRSLSSEKDTCGYQ